MEKSKTPVAIDAAEAPMRAKTSNYPEPYASRMAARVQRPLGDLFGLTRLGVNLSKSALARRAVWVPAPRTTSRRLWAPAASGASSTRTKTRTEA